jgi:hypothetical protein
MGGRGAYSGIARLANDVHPNFTSRQLTPAERQSEVHDAANFILQDLETDPAVMIVIRRDYRGGVPTITLNDAELRRGLSKREVQQIQHSIDEWINKFDKDYRSEIRQSRRSSTLADRDIHDIHAEAIQKARSQLNDAKRKLKKNYKL